MWPVADRMEQFFRDQFLGPQLGTYYGYPVYAPDKNAFYQSVTPAQYRAFSDNIHNESSTWTQNVNLQLVNSSLFKLPAGDVGMAAIFQAGKQHWDNPIDPGVAGDFFFGLSGTSGKGDRTNTALGVEFSVPLLASLMHRRALDGSHHPRARSANAAVIDLLGILLPLGESSGAPEGRWRRQPRTAACSRSAACWTCSRSSATPGARSG